MSVQRKAALRACAGFSRRIAKDAPPPIAQRIAARAARLDAMRGLGSFEEMLAYAGKLPTATAIMEPLSPFAIAWERCHQGRRLVLTVHGELGFIDPAPIVEALSRAAEVRLVFNNAPGGSAQVALSVCNALRRKPCTAIVDGYAASGAVTLLQFCGRRLIRPTAFLMVHGITTLTSGTPDELRREADLAERAHQFFVSLYAERTGLSASEVAAWFSGPDHWFNAEQALAAGLVDEIFVGTA